MRDLLSDLNNSPDSQNGDMRQKR